MAAALTLNATAAVWKDPTTGYSWRYNIVGGGAEIVEIDFAPVGHLTVPSRMDDIEVTRIGNDAFVLSGLGSITIPDSVESIGGGAFFGCDKLRDVYIGAGLSSFGGVPFTACPELRSFTVSKNNLSFKSVSGMLLSKDGNVLLRGVNGDVMIPNGVTEIADYAFGSLHGLTSIYIPNTVLRIGNDAFVLSGLGSITIPDSVESIGGEAFFGCDKLRDVYIGAGLSSFGGVPFTACPELRSFTVSKNNLSFKSVSGMLLSKDGNVLLRGVNGDVMIPNGVTEIADYAFGSLNRLKRVLIPDSVVQIGYLSFFNGFLSVKMAT